MANIWFKGDCPPPSLRSYLPSNSQWFENGQITGTRSQWHSPDHREGLWIDLISMNLNTFFFFLINLFIYLFLAVLGLRFCARAFSSCGERGPLFIAVRGPLTIAASLVAEHRLQTHWLSSCGSWAQLLSCMWDLPRPGLEPVSPALAGRFSTTAPPGKPWTSTLLNNSWENSFPRCEQGYTSFWKLLAAILPPWKKTHWKSWQERPVPKQGFSIACNSLLQGQDRNKHV